MFEVYFNENYIDCFDTREEAETYIGIEGCQMEYADVSGWWNIKEVKQEICSICETRKKCIREDLGGRVGVDNTADVCLNCSVSDKIRRFDEKEISLVELRQEINEALDKVLKWNSMRMER